MIGQYIVEGEQSGKKRVSNFVNTVYEIEKKGSPNLTDSVYQIGATALPHSEVLPEFTLFWSHYLILMRIKNADYRHFALQGEEAFAGEGQGMDKWIWNWAGDACPILGGIGENSATIGR